MDTESVLVSIIMPVYNAQNYLEDTIMSVINQNYDNWQLIIVDDGSSDNSLDVCQKFAEQDTRITVHHKRNGGVSDARNYGIRYASGDLVAFIDDDDIYDQGFIIDGVNNIAEYDADFYKCGREDIYHNENGIITRSVVRNYCCFFIGNMAELRDNYFMYRKSGIAAPVWNAIYKRSIIIENNLGFDTSLKYGQEDISFNSQYCRYVRNVVISDREYYRHHIRKGKSISSKFVYEQLDSKRKSIKEEKNLLNHRYDAELSALEVVECFESVMTVEQKNDFNKALIYMKECGILSPNGLRFKAYDSMTLLRKLCYFLICNKFYSMYYLLVRVVQSLR